MQKELIGKPLMQSTLWFSLGGLVALTLQPGSSIVEVTASHPDVGRLLVPWRSIGSCCCCCIMSHDEL